MNKKFTIRDNNQKYQHYDFNNNYNNNEIDAKDQNKNIKETLNDLIQLFKNDSNKLNLQKIILNLDKAESLFNKLLRVIGLFAMDKENALSKQINFFNELLQFKKLVEENMNKLEKNNQFIKLIDDYLSAIRIDYKKIRNKVQTLQDINIKLSKKLAKAHPDRVKIADLLVRAINEKIPNQIIDSNDNEEKLKVVTEFYKFFIDHASLIRELTVNTINFFYF
jgi:hypothetical protein